MFRLKIVLLACLTGFSSLLAAAPESKLWEFWNTADDTSTMVVDHQAWQTLLDQYLTKDTTDGINRFQYALVTKKDKTHLQNYIKGLTNIDPRKLNKSEQMPYWINLYNALTVELVLKKYPITSIRNIRYFSSPFGPWDKNLIKIANQKLSLNDIEHRILRPIWQDPRIHMAVNCASLGCPNLMSDAFTAQGLAKALQLGAEQFISHPRAVRREGPNLILSSIFDWYAIDFGGSEKQLIEYLSSHLPEEKLDLLQGYTAVKYEYDWSLNESR